MNTISKYIVEALVNQEFCTPEEAMQAVKSKEFKELAKKYEFRWLAKPSIQMINSKITKLKDGAITADNGLIRYFYCRFASRHDSYNGRFDTIPHYTLIISADQSRDQIDCNLIDSDTGEFWPVSEGDKEDYDFIVGGLKKIFSDKLKPYDPFDL